MSNVIDLASRRSAPSAACCRRHALEGVVDRLVDQLTDQGDVLLIPRSIVEDVIPALVEIATDRPHLDRSGGR